MKAKTPKVLIALCAALLGCTAAGDAPTPLGEGGTKWETAEVRDQLSGETVISAVTDKADETNIVRGELKLECHMPSKKMILRLSSYGAEEGADGQLPPAAFADMPQVRFGKSRPSGINEVFVLGESPYNNVVELELEETRLHALVATFANDPIAGAIGVNTEGPESDVRIISQSVAVVEGQLARALADSAQGLLGGCTGYAVLSDCVTHPAHFRRRLSALHEDLAEPTQQVASSQQLVDGITARPDYAQRVAFWTKVASQTAHATLEELARVARFTPSLTPVYGDLYGVSSASMFLEKLGPEVVLGYNAVGGSNTVVLPLGDKAVSSVMNRCR